MADVRSLLKNERAARRIDHPQASYSTTGTLECSVCKLPLKSDLEVWNKHLKSTQHAMRAERLRISTKQPSSKPVQTIPTINTTTTIKGIGNGSKKRKADDEEDEDSRKRTRPEDLNSRKSAKRKVSFDQPSETNATPLPTQIRLARPSPTQVTAPPAPTPSSETVDEDEWAAFEASVARPASPSPPPTTAPTTALTAAATITAAPLSAAEVAARSREEASMQSKERREAEVEGEKEDAARQLEEEFDEMEGLEERVRRLREQREALRLRKAAEAEERKALGPYSEDKPGEMVTTAASSREESEDEDDEADVDDWGVWCRK